jgi:hypothetical protein
MLTRIVNRECHAHRKPAILPLVGGNPPRVAEWILCYPHGLGEVTWATGMYRSSQLLVAVVSDIHGNLTAFEAVLADLRRMGDPIRPIYEFL